ncbi:methylmalonyl Co-A mutase-associated GTPase MeaB [Limibacillus halophilus]|uniref:LAO/AO transport system kinase n=1 Tax=Limibacillus halophilus TaxID=1579333 RepID=A0A839SVT2_9PROT|nr:methylmalonyl Co-A mutase-associated GTPase MeaB [Limibacillus halophilus]MBB3066907.1 LAO/AO transport system kinase [Limibacillus halophilus]
MTLEEIRKEGKAGLARALALLERKPEDAKNVALLDEAYRASQARVIGLTGPPGVGKSTLAGALIGRLRAAGQSVAVIAVDPSSRRSGGALLGDRTRVATDPTDDQVFVRSMAARDRLGGLAELTLAAMVLMRALYDVVLVETVGVGQSETDVAEVADSVVFCVQPGSGDALQFMKAGIMEIPDVAVVTKSDSGPNARKALADLKGALSLADDGVEDAWPVEVLGVSAQSGDGVDSLLAVLVKHWEWLNESSRLTRRRESQARQWLVEALRERFGREGLRRLGLPDLPVGASPFGRLAELSAKVRSAPV